MYTASPHSLANPCAMPSALPTIESLSARTTATLPTATLPSHAGSFRVESGRALGLRPQHDALLRIQQGSVWATLPSQPGDHFLSAGQSLLVKAGEALVIEPWALRRDTGAGLAPAAGMQETVYLDWDPLPICVAQAAPVARYSASQQLAYTASLASSQSSDASSPPPIITTFLIASYDLLTLTLAGFFLRIGTLTGLRAFKAQSSAKRAHGRMASCDSMASSGAL